MIICLEVRYKSAVIIIIIIRAYYYYHYLSRFIYLTPVHQNFSTCEVKFSHFSKYKYEFAV